MKTVTKSNPMIPTLAGFKNLMWSILKSDIHNPVMNAEDKRVWALIAQWAVRDPEFVKAGYDLNKGIMLVGPCGSGKSKLMEVLNRTLKGFNSQLSFTEKITWKVAADFTRFGHDCLLAFGATHYLFDELGLRDREDVAHFKNTVKIGQEIILHRYQQFKSRSVFTHFTTNLKKEQLEEFYGTREFSRLTEMCNFIQYNCEDKRLNGTAGLKTVIGYDIPPDLPSEQEIEDHFVKCCLEAFEKFKSTGEFYDYGNAVYDFLKRKAIITYTSDDEIEFANQADELEKKSIEKKLSDNKSDGLLRASLKKSLTELETSSGTVHNGKRLALVTFFKELIEFGPELSELLNQMEVGASCKN